MAKRKKTLEQKKLADMRHQVYSLDSYSPISSVKREVPSAEHSTSLTTVSYLRHDILKTSILTAAILFSQILLLILIKNRVVSVPFISY
ncbi:MAG: hypothetical protein HYU48_01905 [Candidatus Levybacteria bacterium]|nr:hypothetical protein [Candidatus Levybacteria bacterium]